MKSAQPLELGAIEHHIHAGAERFVHSRQVLHQVVARIKAAVPEAAIGAGNISGEAMETLSLHQLHRSPDESWVRYLDIGVDEEHVGSARQTRPVVSAYGW